MSATTVERSEESSERTRALRAEPPVTEGRPREESSGERPQEALAVQRPKAFRVGISGSYGGLNLGDEAILRLPPGQAYDIPLRCLLPRRVDRVVLAGRCISGTHEAHSSYRVMPIAMATGHAAGVCAALAARTGKDPRDVPAGDAQVELRRQGAVLGAADSS